MVRACSFELALSFSLSSIGDGGARIGGFLKEMDQSRTISQRSCSSNRRPAAPKVTSRPISLQWPRITYSALPLGRDTRRIATSAAPFHSSTYPLFIRPFPPRATVHHNTQITNFKPLQKTSVSANFKKNSPQTYRWIRNTLIRGRLGLEFHQTVIHSLDSSQRMRLLHRPPQMGSGIRESTISWMILRL